MKKELLLARRLVSLAKMLVVASEDNLEDFNSTNAAHTRPNNVYDVCMSILEENSDKYDEALWCVITALEEDFDFDADDYLYKRLNSDNAGKNSTKEFLEEYKTTFDEDRPYAKYIKNWVEEFVKRGIFDPSLFQALRLYIAIYNQTEKLLDWGTFFNYTKKPKNSPQWKDLKKYVNDHAGMRYTRWNDYPFLEDFIKEFYSSEGN